MRHIPGPGNTNWFVCKWSARKYPFVLGIYFVQVEIFPVSVWFGCIYHIDCHWHDASQKSIFSMTRVWWQPTAKSECISIAERTKEKNLMVICTERDLTLTCDILHLHTYKTRYRHRHLTTKTKNVFIHSILEHLEVGKSPKMVENRMKDERFAETQI